MYLLLHQHNDNKSDFVSIFKLNEIENLKMYFFIHLSLCIFEIPTISCERCYFVMNAVKNYNNMTEKLKRNEFQQVDDFCTSI